MTPIELLDAVKVAAEGDSYMGGYEIPVYVDDVEKHGTISPVHVIDRLITEYPIDENTMICVDFGFEDEDWYALSEIDIAGKTRVY